MKRLLPLSAFAFLLFVFSMNSCTKETGTIPPPPADTAHYQADIVPVLQTYCYGQGSQACHVTNSNQSSPGDFTKYADLKAKVDAGLIQSRVFVNKDMPPSYSTGPTALTNADLQKFQSWVNAGAKND